jgi:hypothetical protein
MKLNIVPARTGFTWVKLGFKTFFRQPLALSGLFFMFMAILSIATLVPLIGSVLALALLPAATLGLMAATREATGGKFPMPTLLISAFRAGRQQMRAMMVLGALYAVGFLAVMAISALFDGGQFARLYLLGGKISEEIVSQGDFQMAMWCAVALYLPLSLMFWHAPALVHWHGISPVKSLFFSFMACYKNFGALTVFGLAWMAAFMASVVVVTLMSVLIGNPTVATIAMFPLALVMVAVFFTSIYFTFRDSFVASPGEDSPVDASDIPPEPGNTP